MCYLNSEDTEEGETLTHYCRQCGLTFPFEENEGCVLDTNTKSNASEYQTAIGPYTHLDPTLPRTQEIPCPTCSVDAAENPEVVFVRYDNQALSYVYLCTKCKTAWKVEDSA